MGWRQAGCYRWMWGQSTAGWHRREVLGLELRAEGWLLRYRDPRHGWDLLTHAETSRPLRISEHERDKSERKGEVAAEARRTAERERSPASQRDSEE